MSKNVLITEGGNPKLMAGVKRLKLEPPQGGSNVSFWVPEDERRLMTKTVSKNGVYRPEDDLVWGYDKVNVAIPGYPEFDPTDPTLPISPSIPSNTPIAGVDPTMGIPVVAAVSPDGMISLTPMLPDNDMPKKNVKDGSAYVAKARFMATVVCRNITDFGYGSIRQYVEDDDWYRADYIVSGATTYIEDAGNITNVSDDMKDASIFGDSKYGEYVPMTVQVETIIQGDRQSEESAIEGQTNVVAVENTYYDSHIVFKTRREEMMLRGGTGQHVLFKDGQYRPPLVGTMKLPIPYDYLRYGQEDKIINLRYIQYERHTHSQSVPALEDAEQDITDMMDGFKSYIREQTGAIVQAPKLVFSPSCDGYGTLNCHGPNVVDTRVRISMTPNFMDTIQCYMYGHDGQRISSSKSEHVEIVDKATAILEIKEYLMESMKPIDLHFSREDIWQNTYVSSYEDQKIHVYAGFSGVSGILQVAYFAKGMSADIKSAYFGTTEKLTIGDEVPLFAFAAYGTHNDDGLVYNGLASEASEDVFELGA